ncbi:MAG: DUF692 domain-containing protein [Polyangiales bacterium]
MGLRQAIAEPLLAVRAGTNALPELQFLEIHPENYIARGGRFRALLERAQAHWPILTHGLTLGLGAVEPADPGYVRELGRLLEKLAAPWHSEHLCFSSADGVMSHDLLPLPFTHDAVRVAVDRVRELRDALERPVAIENISYYAHPGDAEMDEAEFLTEVLEQADAKLLLDVNNIYVNSRNHGFDALRFLERLPLERVVQIHVAGHSQRPDGLLIDTHGTCVRDEVYVLLEHALARTGPRPVLLERDQSFPEIESLFAEVRRLHASYTRATGVAWR